MSWTTERVEILKIMWSEGQSASQIAGKLGGVTRNAVIGKVHRLGLSNRDNINTKAQKVDPIKEKPSNRKIQKKQKDDKLISSFSKENLGSEDEKNLPMTGKGQNSVRPTFTGTNKSIIFTANQPLPPQPSTSEISEETLKNVETIEKKSKKLSLMDLTERTCKWPIGDPATDTFWFCGHAAEQGKPYCETHIEIAFQPVAARRERRSR